MIDIDIIEREIRDLEARGDTTYSQCERLSWLYVVRDHLTAPKQDASTEWMMGSEFLEASSGTSYRKLMTVLDEHMSALAVVQPKEYEAVMDKIRALR